MTAETPSRKRGPYAKSARKRRRIIEAATEIFASHGYNGGSLQDVADRIGLSQTGLLHYFPTKRDLLVAVLHHRDEVTDTGPVAASGRDFASVLVDQAEYNESVPGLIELYSVLCGEAVTDDYPARDYFVRRFDRVRREYAGELRALADAGRLRQGVDPERAAASIVALWDGIQIQWLFEPSIDMAGCLRDYLNSIILPPAVPGEHHRSHAD